MNTPERRHTLRIIARRTLMHFYPFGYQKTFEIHGRDWQIEVGGAVGMIAKQIGDEISSDEAVFIKILIQDALTDFSRLDAISKLRDTSKELI